MWEFSQDSIISQLKVDQAYLNVTSLFDKNLWLYQLSSECVEVSPFAIGFCEYFTAKIMLKLR